MAESSIRLLNVIESGEGVWPQRRRAAALHDAGAIAEPLAGCAFQRIKSAVQSWKAAASSV